MIAGFPGDGGCRETGTASKKKWLVYRVDALPHSQKIYMQYEYQQMVQGLL